MGHVQKLLPKQTDRGFVRRDCDCVAGGTKHHDANVRVARSMFCRHAISEERLRAINRAPDAIKDAYREGRISQTLAAKLGPKNPPPEKAALVAEIAGEIRTMKDRKAVDGVVRQRLGHHQDTPVDRAIRLVERMNNTDRRKFAEAVKPLLLDAEAWALTGMR